MKEVFFDTIIIGSGCAGFNCADRLFSFGKRNIAIVTEGLNCGTSRNTGSDKQTYYKLSLASDDGDSVGEMAADLYRHGGVNGDTALIEAAESVRAFMHLVEIGVPFPTNEFGEYVGYKTDHDPKQRATSAGPLTSKYMTEALERQVKQKDIPIFDCCQAVKIVVQNNRVCGLFCIDTKSGELLSFSCRNVVLATGGEAGVYKNSVYPGSQSGGLGLAIEAGAKCANLNQWQYGIASVKFRWNLSGSYQQALPKYVKVDKTGNQSELFTEYFFSPEQALNMVFLKGYQWPFDVNKVSGSSVIDLIVHYETAVLGNKIYLDYTNEPSGLTNGFDCLSIECKEYLKNCGAFKVKPIERLKAINPQAIALYKSYGIDLEKELLEISVCAQHQNGGVAVDANWESSISGLFAAGEAAGTFGTYRPGGAALNSTQVGSLRAARHIASKQIKTNSIDFTAEVKEIDGLITACLANNGKPHIQVRNYFQLQMSKSASHLRNTAEMKQIKEELGHYINQFDSMVSLSEKKDSATLLKTRDILLAMQEILLAMDYANENIGSIGSALGISQAGELLKLIWEKNAVATQAQTKNQILITEKGKAYFENTRKIPYRDLWFESVWQRYKQF